MQTSDVQPGCEPIVEDNFRKQMLWILAEQYRTEGCLDIKARLPGFVPPPIVSGTERDFRFDMTFRQTDKGRTPAILETITTNDIEDDKTLESRISLIFSAAELYGAQIYFAVPDWDPRFDVKKHVEQICNRLDFQKKPLFLPIASEV